MPFGGAGALHAVEIARELGIRSIVVPAAPGILCAEGVAAAHDTTIDLEIVPGYPVTVNDPDSTTWFRGLAVALAGEAKIDDLAAPLMGAEDFSYVLERVPGLMAYLGARPDSEDPATAPQNHSNIVILDENAMALGVALYAAAALDTLATD